MPKSADIFGYVMPGQPEKAAGAATRAFPYVIKTVIWRSEMFVAAMIAGAFGASDAESIVKCA